MTSYIDSLNWNSPKIFTSPISMENHSKFEDNVKKLRRYSGIFEPLQRPEPVKLGRTRKSCSAAVDLKSSEKHDKDKVKSVKSIICEPNLHKVESNKPSRRKSSHFSKEIANGDQASPKLMRELSNKTSSKISSDSKHTKQKKSKRESKSPTTSGKEVSTKENVSKNSARKSGSKSSGNQLLEKNVSKSENHLSVPKHPKKDHKSHKKNVKIEVVKPITPSTSSTPSTPSITESETVDPEIMKYYLDKTVKKFNNLETIFESPKGSDTYMGRRKLRRYVNFDDTNSPVRRAKRKVRLRKINSDFKLDNIDLEALNLLDVEDLFK